jgi:hypothetical protein
MFIVFVFNFMYCAAVSVTVKSHWSPLCDVSNLGPRWSSNAGKKVIQGYHLGLQLRKLLDSLPKIYVLPSLVGSYIGSRLCLMWCWINVVQNSVCLLIPLNFRYACYLTYTYSDCFLAISLSHIVLDMITWLKLDSAHQISYQKEKGW